MTRISGAPQGLNSFLDQIVNARSDASSSGNATDGTGGPGFDSHMASLGPDENNSTSTDNFNTPAQSPQQDVSSNQKTPANAVSALFAALTNGGDTQNSSAPQMAQGNRGDAASALLASLADSGDNQASPVHLPASGDVSTNASSANLNANVPSGSSQTQLSALLALAKSGAKPNAAVNNQAAAANPAQDANLSDDANPLRSDLRLTVQKTAITNASSAKRTVESAPSPAKHNDQAANASPDLSATAQATVAMVAASLAPQNPVSSPAMRKDMTAQAGGSNTAPANGKNANGQAPMNIQSPSDSLQPVTQDNAPNPFADFSASDESDSQPIKMTVSSIQAETHFAPVQQLSPTQQIFDFVALTGGVSSLSDSSAAASTGSSVSTGGAASITASLSAPPVKTLTLALEPDTLGTVTVKMRLVNSGLDVQVEAAKSETASLIEKDKDSLSAKLQSLGYSVDSLVVKTAAAEGSNLNPSNDQAGGQGQHSANDAPASNLPQSGGHNSNDQSPAQNRGQPGSSFNQDSGPDVSSISTVSDGIYV